MKLTTQAIGSFRGNNRLKSRVALEMDKSVYTVDRWINENEVNGPLTTATAVQVIKQETGLDDADILEKETANEQQS